MAITMAFTIVQVVYAGELFPTEVRMQGIGSSMFVSRIGGVLAPYVANSLVRALALCHGVYHGISLFIQPAVEDMCIPHVTHF